MSTKLVCAYVMALLMLLPTVAGFYLGDTLTAAACLVTAGMCYFYASEIKQNDLLREVALEAQEDEEYADKLMHEMWEVEGLEEKYIKSLAKCFGSQSYFSFISYFKQFTCSEVTEVEGTEWTHVSYCPYNHPGLYVSAFVKPTQFVAVSLENTEAMTSYLKDWVELQKEQENADRADRAEELDLCEDLILYSCAHY